MIEFKRTRAFCLGVLLLLAMFLLLAACDKSVRTAVVQTQGAGEPASGETAAAPKNTQVQHEVLLFPAPLRSLDSARAGVKGCDGIVRYSWAVNGIPISADRTGTLPQDHFQRGDTVTVFAACNGVKTQASAVVENSPPQVRDVAIVGQEVVGGQQIELAPDAFDPEGDLIGYLVEWLIDGEVLEYEDRLTLPGDYVQKGRKLQVRITPRDPYAQGPVYRSLAFVVPNAVPQFTTQPPREFFSREYVYAAEAEDPDGELLNYRLDEGPTGMSIDPVSGKLVWQIAAETTGNFPVRIVAQDPEGAYAEQSFALTLDLKE